MVQVMNREAILASSLAIVQNLRKMKDNYEKLAEIHKQMRQSLGTALNILGVWLVILLRPPLATKNS